MLILVATVSDVSAIQLSGDERLWRDQLLHRPTHHLALAVDALGTKKLWDIRHNAIRYGPKHLTCAEELTDSELNGTITITEKVYGINLPDAIIACSAIQDRVIVVVGGRLAATAAAWAIRAGGRGH